MKKIESGNNSNKSLVSKENANREPVVRKDAGKSLAVKKTEKTGKELEGKFVVSKEVALSSKPEKKNSGKKSEINPIDTIERRPARRSKKKPVILVIVLLLLAGIGAGVAYLANKGQEFYADTQMMEAKVDELKTELKAVGTHVKNGDYEAADASIVKVDAAIVALRTELADPKWELATNIPDIDEDLKTAGKLLDIASEASDKLMKPGVKYLREKGLPKKETFTLKKILSPEFSVMLKEYADVIDEFCPEVEKLIADIDSLPKFKIEKLENKISKYRTLVKENEKDILAYTKFLKDVSSTLLRPTAEMMEGKELSIGEGNLTEMLNPKFGEQLNVYCDLVEKLFPALDKILEEFDALPKVKIEEIEAKLDKVRKLAKNEDIKQLRSLLEEAVPGLLRPTAEVLIKTPFSKLRVNNGIDTKVIKAYLDLAEKIKPFIIKITPEIKNNAILKKHPEILEKITTKLDDAAPLLEEFDDYKPLIDLVLGDGSDKLYVLVAMNSAEIRACGGFPGAVGAITIKNGVLRVGKFTSVYANITYKSKKLIKPTAEENKLFKELGFGTKLTSCTLNPHFPRVAQIIAKGYKHKHKLSKMPDGVIAMTPHIIGRMIAITEPITLFNGQKLDSKYAIRYLQRDIYVKYFKKANTAKKRKKADDRTSALFADAANQTLSNVLSNLSADGIKKAFNVIKTSGKDRVFMMWMSNSEAQKKVKSLGFSGALNYNKKKPEVGVFVNIYDANKLGPYVDLKVNVGKGKKNKNGTITYLVTVRMKNTLDKKTQLIGQGNDYILSRKGGASMRTIMYFFAPYGGTISGFGSSRKDAFQRNGKYKKCYCFYTPKFYLHPRQTVTITFYVTTAKGVTAKPKVVHMPLLSKYKNAKPPK